MQYDLFKSILVGQGATTVATAEYLLEHKHPFLIYSLQENCLPSHLSSYFTQKLDGMESIYWLSPGLSFGAPIIQSLLPNRPKILDIDFFLDHTPSKVILVTGTNGKSTVCLYIHKLLNSLGRKSYIGGNYQPGLLTCLSQRYDYIIIELSSFQLSRLKSHHRVEVALLLNITPDHENWHGSMSRYVQDKMQVLTYGKHNIVDKNLGVDGCYTYQNWLEHQYCTNLEGIDKVNMAAALSVIESLGYTPMPICGVLPQLPFRMKTYQKSGRIIINDSKATNPAATCAAIHQVLKLYDLPILLILAGQQKADFPDLPGLLSPQIKLIVVGRSYQIFNEYVYKRLSKLSDLKCYVQKHHGVILFSPSGSSYDMFRDYIDRGNKFDALINKCL